MKILFQLPRFHTNQVGIIQALHSHGHTVDIHVSNCHPNEYHENINILMLPNSNLSLFIQHMIQNRNSSIKPFAFPPLLPYLRLINNYDVIVVREFGRLLSILTIVFCAITRKHCIVVTQTINENELSPLKRRSVRFLHSLFRFTWVSPVLIPTSPTTLKPSILRYLPFTIPTKKYSQYEDLDKSIPSSITFLCVGKYGHSRKHLGELIDLFIRLASKLPSINIDFICSGSTVLHTADEDYSRLLKRSQSQVHPNLRIILMKDTEYTRMFYLYAKSDVFILPASSEPASISLIEALSEGCFSICSNQNGTRHYIPNSKYGRVFPAGDFASLEEIIVEYCHTHRLIALHKQKRKYEFNRIYNQQAFLKRFDDIILSR
jgi:glycosyltransferase involved in cell wall biosynthesis